MSKNIFDMKRQPVNKTAGLITGRGEHWTPNKRIQTADSDTPLPVRDLRREPSKTVEMARALVGKRCGRLTVIGLSADQNKRWVVRCQCGTYTLRSAKAISNPNNKLDCCENCRHLLYLKRNEIFRRTGKYVEWEDLE